jgi:hypothetical protein
LARGTPRRSPRWSRYAPAFRPGGAPSQAGRAWRVVDAARAVVRRGDRRCALARVCADVWARACAGVQVCRYSCAYKRRDTCMCVCTCIYIFRHMCTCARDGYGRACGCTTSNAHVGAIARADDAAVAITCARVGTSAGICSQRTRHVQYPCIYASTQSPGM